MNKTAKEVREGIILPELLCPAGSYDSLCAAIDGGADAVYMGGVAFNARIHAKNFTPDEFERAIALAHTYGVKVYVTVNTLIRDKELEELLRTAEQAYDFGADALIIADTGAAKMIKERVPIELHASTQLSCHSTDAARILEAHGFSRVVCAREMSREDIRSFVDNSPLEAEVFVHGALCVCHSGQCLFSSMVGGRSGNRGECAQPCRLPYGGNNKYPLSLKDLSLARHLPELCSIGVSSLKIEGRMKSPEYVHGVTKIWRSLLDDRRAATAEDMRALEAIFSRDGFTDGYFTSRIDRKMLGVRSEAQKKETRQLEPFKGITRKIPVRMSVEIKADKPCSLTVTRLDGKGTATSTGDVPQTARTAPISEETVRRSLVKLGDTPFEAKKIEISLDQGLMLPVSSLNALRRGAIDRLASVESLTKEAVEHKPYLPIHKRGKRPERINAAIFYAPENIPSEASGYFDIIYTPIDRYDGSTNGVALPEVIFDSQRADVERMLTEAKEKGAEHLLVGNLGHLDLARSSGLIIHGDFRLNVFNSETADFVESLGFEDAVLSPELTLSQMRDIGGNTYSCIYGRVPLMVTEKCVGKEIGGCDKCNSGRAVLTDRRGITFPVLRAYGHRSVIFNSVPFYMADKTDALDANGLSMRFFIFSTESRSQAAEVIQAYKKGMTPRDPSKIKRIK